MRQSLTEMNKTVASVIIPLYNAENYVCKIAKNLKEQSISDIEVIFVDDGSIDNSYRIAKEVSDRDSRFKAIRIDHCGVSRARNVGISSASGEILLFIDADDVIRRDYIEVLTTNMQDDTDLVVCNYQYEDEAGNVIRKNELSNCLLSTEAAESAVIDTLGFEGYVWNKAFRKKTILDNHVVFDESLAIYEDMHFLIRYLQCIKRNISYINECLYHYIAHHNGAMVNTSIHKKENGLYASVKIFDLLKDRKARRSAIQFFWTTYLDWVFYAVNEKNYKPSPDFIKDLDSHIRLNKREIISADRKKTDALIACFFGTNAYLKIVKLKILLLAWVRKND